MKHPKWVYAWDKALGYGVRYEILVNMKRLALLDSYCKKS
jgi:hypothetical protein